MYKFIVLSEHNDAESAAYSHLAVVNDLVQRRVPRDPELLRETECLLKLQDKVRHLRVLLHATLLRLPMQLEGSMFVSNSVDESNALLRELLTQKPPVPHAVEFAAYGVADAYQTFDGTIRERVELCILGRARRYLSARPMEKLGTAYARLAVCTLSDDTEEILRVITEVRREGGWRDISKAHERSSKRLPTELSLTELEKAILLLDGAPGSAATPLLRRMVVLRARQAHQDIVRNECHDHWGRIDRFFAEIEGAMRVLEDIADPAPDNFEGGVVKSDLATALMFIGEVCLCHDRPNEGRESLERALTIFRALGKEEYVAAILRLKGDLDAE